MKRRIKKKKMEKLYKYNSGIYLIGNNGGDVLDIVPSENGRVYLQSGCSCVMTINEYVPVEFITMALQECILKHGSIKGFILSTSYSDEYKEELISKVGGYK